MKSQKPIVSQIVQLIGVLEAEYPEIYGFLNENPMTIPSKAHPDIDRNTFVTYLDDLRQLLNHHLQTRKANES